MQGDLNYFLFFLNLQMTQYLFFAKIMHLFDNCCYFLLKFSTNQFYKSYLLFKSSSPIRIIIIFTFINKNTYL